MSVVKKSTKNIPCRHWDECGGCPLIRNDYKSQLHYKYEKVKKAFLDAGFESSLVKNILRPTHSSPVTLGYRNKAKWIFQKDSQTKKLKMGIYYPGTHEVVDIPDCAVHANAINEVSFYVKQKLIQYDVSCGSEQLESSTLRYLIVRYSFRDRKLILVFVTSSEKVEGLENVFKDLEKKWGDKIVAIVQNINSDSGNVLLGEANRFIRKTSELTEQMGKVRIPVGPLSFLQVNSSQAGYLYNRVKTLMGKGPYQSGLDLYSGVGIFALHLSAVTKQILSVEDMGSAALEAITSARRNRVNNVLHLCADALEGVSTFHSEFGTPDWVVLNPPRKGCENMVLQAIASRPPRRIAYVSCNPVTLARDIGILMKEAPDLELKTLEPVDMFPQTDHVECIAFLDNRAFKKSGKKIKVTGGAGAKSSSASLH